MAKTDPETYTEAETIARREAALKRAFVMPHKPHKPMGAKADESSARKPRGSHR